MNILEAAELGRKSVLDFIQILKNDCFYTEEQRKHFIAKAIPEWRKIADELESAICAEKYGAVEHTIDKNGMKIRIDELAKEQP